MMYKYQLHELTQSFFAPLHAFSRVAALARDVPLGWTLPPMMGFGVGGAILERMTRDYGKPAFKIHHVVIDGAEIEVTETILDWQPFCHLVNFRKATALPQPKLLIVAPLSGHYATLVRGTVIEALKDYDVYITDWINARDVPTDLGNFHFATYVDYIRHFLEVIGDRVHVLAVCQPSVPVMAAAALMSEDKHPNRPLSMMFMGGPIDTRIAQTEVNTYAENHDMEWFETHAVDRVPSNYVGAGRLVYPGFMQLSAFLAMNPSDHVRSHREMFKAMMTGDVDIEEKRVSFYDEYMSVMDLPAPFYLETIDLVFKNHALPRGNLRIGARLVDTKAITDIGIMTIEGEKDDITGPGQCAAAHDLTPNVPADRHDYLLQPGAGHYGLFSGSRFRATIYPRMKAFMAAQSAEVHQLKAKPGPRAVSPVVPE
jgi:poly(3-hydroxybutyrate) depolymerase